MAVCAFVRLADPLPARIARELLFDQYQRLKPRAYDPQPVRIVDIDEASLAAIGQWPGGAPISPASSIACTRLGAASIAFDMVFPETRPDVARQHRTTPGRACGDWRRGRGTFDAKLPDNDKIFAAALADSNIVLGFGILPGENTFRPVCKAGLAFTGLDPVRSIAGFAAAIGNIPALQNEAAGLGAISISPQDNQGIVRQVPLGVERWARCLPEPGAGGSPGRARRPDDPCQVDARRTRGGAFGPGWGFRDSDDAARRVPGVFQPGGTRALRLDRPIASGPTR